MGKMDREIVDVDIHCHSFNAGDLPVGGFIRKLLKNPSLAEKTPHLLRITPTYESDLKEVARVLKRQERGSRAASEELGPEPHDAYDPLECLAELKALDPSLPSLMDPNLGAEGIGDMLYFGGLSGRRFRATPPARRRDPSFP